MIPTNTTPEEKVAEPSAPNSKVRGSVIKTPRTPVKRSADFGFETDASKPKRLKDNASIVEERLTSKNNLFVPPHLRRTDLDADVLKTSLKLSPHPVPPPPPQVPLPFERLHGLNNPFLVNMLKNNPIFPLPEKDFSRFMSQSLPPLPYPCLNTPMMSMYPGVGSLSSPFGLTYPNLNPFHMYNPPTRPFASPSSPPTILKRPESLSSTPPTPLSPSPSIPQMPPVSPREDEEALNLTKEKIANHGHKADLRGYRSLPYPLMKKDGKMHYECNVCQKVSFLTLSAGYFLFVQEKKKHDISEGGQKVRGVLGVFLSFCRYSDNCPTWKCIYAHTRESVRSSVRLVARASRSSRTCRSISLYTPGKNHTNVR